MSVARKVHRYLGIFIALVMLYVSISGILLNHPELLKNINAPIWLLPGHMRVKNWSRGAILAGIQLENGDYLTGGKIGILRFNSKGKLMGEENQGLPKYLYKKHVNVLYYFRLLDRYYAGTVSGLFYRSGSESTWTKDQQVHEDVKAIFEVDGNLHVISASNAFRFESGNFEQIPFTRQGETKVQIPLVSYFFDLHSGRVLGLPGRFLMDIGGLALLSLALTGLYMWIIPRRLRTSLGKRVKKSLLRYHHLHYRKIGALLLIPALILPITGLFMQPPFIILLVGRAVAGRLHVNPPEPGGWNGAVERAVLSEDGEKLLVIAGLKIYEGKSDFSESFKPLEAVVPVHPMGATYIGELNEKDFLIGSFSGLLRWEPVEGGYYDYFTDELVTRPRVRIPKDSYQVNGIMEFDEHRVVIDYHNGIFELAEDRSSGNPSSELFGEPIFEMPEEYRKRSTFSLWHYLFEVHNGRIWRGMIGGFYIFHTMVVAISAIVIMWTGLQIMLIHRKRKKKGG